MAYDVALTPCGSYDDETVETAMLAALEQIDGLDFVKPGMRVAIKANLITAMKPDAAATTHPAVVCALTRILRRLGAEVVVGDSPGGVYSAAYLRVVYDVCGLKGAAQCGAKLNDDFSVIEADYPEAVKARRFPYTAYLAKADAIIDLCKLKTHGMMGMTCAVKNFFGSIPGTAKPEYHYKFPRAEDFANVLVDLYEYSAPRLCVCDAVAAMEGNGPTQGTPRQIGCLLASKNGHMLDLVAAGLIGAAPREIPTLRAAMERGLVPEDAAALSVYGDAARFAVADFKTVPAQSSVFFGVLGGGLAGGLADMAAGRMLAPYPKLEPALCVGCGRCAQTCPAKAITMKEKKPRINRSSCIHCFCCQELCPKGALKVQKTRLMKLLRR